MGEWIEVKLSEIADVQTGPFGSQLHMEDYVERGTPIVTVEHLGNREFSSQNLPRVTDADKERLQKYILKTGDVVFSRVGSVDRCSYVSEKENGWMFSGRCLRIRSMDSSVEPLYLYYYFSSEPIKQLIRSIAVGATMPSINTSILSGIPISLPPLPEQKRIAHILGTLDDKIELNRRMNATLETMARALFKSWFVDFDPVRAKLDGHTPEGIDPETAALFPSAFQDSPLGQIPKGWSTATLGDIGLNPRRGVKPSGIEPNTPYIALEHMPRRSIALNEWDESADVASGKLSFRKGEILFGKLRPYFHKVGVAPVNGVCSTDILVLTPKSPEWFGFLLYHASSDELIQFTDLASTGTKMPRTNWNHFSLFKVTLPKKAVATSFTRNIQPMIDRITVNIHESRTLANLRDTLLPKLLKGEL